MKLDHNQRLNVEYIIGQQRGCTVEDLRLCWKILDSIRLTADELQAISYRKEQQNGNVIAMWDATKSIPALDCEFPAEEQARIRKALEEWQYGYSASDRSWLEPLLEALHTKP